MKEAIRRTSYIEKLSDEIVEEMLYTLRQEQFENRNVIFREGDMCKGIIFVMEGGIELSYTENGNSIVIDTLMQGSYLFSYSCLTEERITMTGVALGKTTVLVLPYETLDVSRNVNADFHQELEVIEDYIQINGVPLCDYTRPRPKSITPRRRFRSAVKKIIALQRLEQGKKMTFTALINMLRSELPSNIDRQLTPSSQKEPRSSKEEQTLEPGVRRISPHLFKQGSGKSGKSRQSDEY